MCCEVDKGQLQRLLTVPLALGLSEPTGNREAMQEPQTEGAHGPLDSGNAIDLALPGRKGKGTGVAIPVVRTDAGVLILNPLQLRQTQPASNTHPPPPRRRLHSKVSPAAPLASGSG